jgi:peptide/nickel transport system ATP-binding protein
LTEPALIIADEPTTALDVTIQAEIMSLMLALCKTHGVGLILITHDLAVVSQVTQRVVVLYAGRVVETGQTARVVHDPVHPYTRGLLAALPGEGTPGARLNQIRGGMPSLNAIPEGCAFHPRCDFVQDRCRAAVPPLDDFDGHRVRCVRADDLIAGAAA